MTSPQSIARRTVIYALRLFLLVTATIPQAHSAPVTFKFEGVITEADSRLSDSFVYGQNFTGSYTFDPDAPLTGGNENVGYADFGNAISAMSFTSNGYTVSASNGDISQEFQDITFYKALFNPISGSSVGEFVPANMGVLWVKLTTGPFLTLPVHPEFDSDIPSYQLSPLLDLYDSEGNLVYGDSEGLIGDPNQPLFYTNGAPELSNGILIFTFARANGEFATLIGQLTSVTDANDDLLAHWPLDEGRGKTAQDVSGNGHDGKLVHKPAWRFDSVLNANTLWFDGKNDLVNIRHFDVSGEAMTLAGWVNPQKLDNCRHHDCRIISKAFGTAENDHYWMVSTIKVGDKTRLRFRLKTDGTTSTLIAATGDLQNGVPFHVAAVYDGTHMRLYKDGVEVGKQLKSGVIDMDPGVKTWLGGNPNDAKSRPWKGLIADIRVYERALSPSEINTLKDHFAAIDPANTFLFEGEITEVDASLADAFTVGDTFTGSYLFDPDAPLTGGDANIGDAEFGNAISNMSFTSRHYRASANNGSISQYFEDEDFYHARFRPVSGFPVGRFAPQSMGLSWITNTQSTFDSPILHPGFDPDLPPYIFAPYENYYDADGNLIYETVRGLLGDPDQPLFTESGDPAPVNGSYEFRFVNALGETAIVKGKLSSVTKPMASNSQNLLAHWPLNEGQGKLAHDVTDHGYDGKLAKKPTWTYNAALKSYELLFDGKNDHVNVGAIDVPGKAMTLTAWVDPGHLENCGHNDCRILSKATGTAESDHYWMLSTIKVGNKTRLRFRLKTNGSTSTLIAESGDLDNGVPFHVAAIYDGMTMRLYKDGVEVGRGPKTGNIDTNPSVKTWIGGNPNKARSRPWKGKIADVRIFQKALSVSTLNDLLDSH